MVNTPLLSMGWFSGTVKKDFQFLRTSITANIYNTDQKLAQLKQNTNLEGFKQTDPKTGDSLLHIAAEEGELEILKYLLSQDLDVNVKNNNDDTLLHAAVQGKDTKKQNAIITFLLNENLDINAKNKEQSTPLLLAIGNGNLALIKLLIENHNAGMPYSKTNGDNELIYAARLNNPTITAYIAQSLSKKGYVISNMTDNDAKTALMIAVENGSLETVKALLNTFKDQKTRTEYINKLDKNNLNALHHIGLGYDKRNKNEKTDQLRKNLLEITKILLQNGGNTAQESGDIKVGSFHGSGRIPAGVASYAGLDDVNKLMVKQSENQKQAVAENIQNLANALSKF